MSSLFSNYRNMLLGGGNPTGYVDLNGDTIKVLLVDNGVAPAIDVTSMTVRSNLTGTGQIVATATLSGATIGTIAVGVLDATNTTFTAVSGQPAEQLVVFKDTGNNTTSPLLILFDGFSVTPSGGDVIVNWDSAGLLAL